MEYCWRCNNTVELDEAGHCPSGHSVRAPQGGWQNITLPENPLPPETQPASAVAVATEPDGATSIEESKPPRRPRRVLTTVVVAGIALVGVLGYVLFGGKTSAEAALYRRVFVAGDVHRYAFTMGIEGDLSVAGQRQPINMRMTMRLAEEVLSVEQDGTARVRYTISEMSGTANGQAIPLPPVLPTVTVRMAPDGQVLSVDWAGAPGLQSLSSPGNLFSPGTVNPILPPKKAAPGYSWTVVDKRAVPFAGGDVSTTLHNKLLSVGTIGRGQKTATIRSIVDAPLDFRLDLAKLAQSAGAIFGSVPANAFPPGASAIYDGKMKMTTTQTIARETGRPLQMLGEGDMDVRVTLEGVPAAAGQAVDMAFHLTMSFTDVEGGL